MGIKWTDKEIEYLECYWGVDTLKVMCRKLNRTESAIRGKAYKLSLGRYTDNGNYITFNYILDMLGSPSGEKYKRLLRNNLPVHYKRVKKSKVRVVYLNEFWKWAEENRYILDLSRLQPNILGEESKWFKEKRKQDIQTKMKYRTGEAWTEKEDSYLIFLLKEYKYTYEDISKMINRECETIRKRINTLKLKDRPIIAITKWTEEEVEVVRECIKQGVKYELIAEKINKTTKQIRTKVYSLYSTENLNKVNSILRKVG